MKPQADPPLHLTYCLNIHPGESWDENLAAIRTHALAIRDIVAPGRAFALGLRVGFEAAKTLSQPATLKKFRDFLAAENLYVFTVNGFPYGRFHGAPVKQQVYAPDWRSDERRDYTILLVEILAALLPEGLSGSISTVPGSHRPWIAGPRDVARMAENLTRVALRLAALEQDTGKTIRLALEPEPDCYLQTTAEAAAFLAGPLPRAGRALSAGEELLRRHVGVCMDTSHTAVQFEDPAEALEALRSAGVGVAKIQLSAALQARPTPQSLAALAMFEDPVYLHQVRVRQAGGAVAEFPDLSEALGSTAARAAESLWRVHFHVPLFFEGYEGLESTSSLLAGRFAERLRQGACEHLEIETYTFDVLPASIQPVTVVEAVAQEYVWVLDRLLSTPGRD
jgi:sugar phosphate isomerase/epimerase